MNDYMVKLLKACKQSDELGFSLNDINYKFRAKPILIGGKALEYYGVRDAGDDYDFVVDDEDLKDMYAIENVRKKVIDGDNGIVVGSFEFWSSIYLFDYDFYLDGAVEEEEYFVISFEKLMFVKVFSCDSSKSLADIGLMSKRMVFIRDIDED